MDLRVHHVLRPIERLENAFLIALRDADPAILDLYLNASVAVRDPYAQPTLSVAVLDRVLYEIQYGRG
jgi:hypothetical protein